MKRLTKLTSLILALMMLLCSMNIALAETTETSEMRIVCMAPSRVECVYALGLGEIIGGGAAYTDYHGAASTTSGK